MRASVIDIGSNTILLLIGDTIGPRFYLDTERFAGLGEGILKNGYFSRESIERTREILSEYLSISKKWNVEKILPFGTEASRRAKNVDMLDELVRDITGSPLDVISGEEEAYLGFISCYVDIPKERRIISVDIGGGSTEIVCGNYKKVEFSVSLPIGSVFLTREFVHHDPPKREEIDEVKKAIKRELGKIQVFKGEMLVGLGGTITTLGMLDLNLKSYSHDALNMHIMDSEKLSNMLSLINSLPREKRMEMGIPEGRVDFLGIGGLILEEICNYFGFREVVVSTRGVRYGYFMKKLMN